MKTIKLFFANGDTKEFKDVKDLSVTEDYDKRYSFWDNVSNHEFDNLNAGDIERYLQDFIHSSATKIIITRK